MGKLIIKNGKLVELLYNDIEDFYPRYFKLKNMSDYIVYKPQTLRELME